MRVIFAPEAKPSVPGEHCVNQLVRDVVRRFVNERGVRVPRFVVLIIELHEYFGRLARRPSDDGAPAGNDVMRRLRALRRDVLTSVPVPAVSA